MVDISLCSIATRHRARDPGGIAEILDFKNRRPLESDRAIIPRPDLLGPPAWRCNPTPAP
jgi:hypothetical protein